MASVKDVKSMYEKLLQEVSKVVVGKEEVIQLLTIALFSEGHVLLEGVPGVAKTLITKAFARALGLDFKRIQFTPDMMPADIVGTFVFNQKMQDFIFREGAVFTNVLLGDEINRTSPKTQSALLEAMQERQVTVEGFTKRMEEPFIVMANQNPVEHEGTYPLPEAQLDRFMFRVVVDYPSHEEGVRILQAALNGMNLDKVRRVISKEEILDVVATIKGQVFVSTEILNYITLIVEATRRDRSKVLLGGSPRSSVHLLLGCKSLAAMNGRSYVIPDDVKKLAFHTLNHRILLRPEYLVESISTDDPYHYNQTRLIVDEALSTIEPPK